MRLLSFFKFRYVIFILLGGCLFGGITAWRHQTPALTSSLQSLPQDPLIQVYFNHSQAAFYTEPYRQQKRLGDDLEQIVIDAIATAQTSIDVAVHELNLPRVAAALKAKHQAGVKIRVVVENSYRRFGETATNRSPEAGAERERQKYLEFLAFADRNHNQQLEPIEIAQSDALSILQNAQVPLIDDTADGSKGSDLMHHKFIVIDDKEVLVGSANLTWSDVHGDFLNPASLGNANHLLRIKSAAVAQLFTQEFNWLWGDGAAGRSDSRFGVKKPYRPPQQITLAPGSTVTLQFSPTSRRRPWNQSANGLISRTLNRATRSVELALFVFSEQQLSNTLEAVHRRGVSIRALVEPSFAYRDYSEILDLLGVALANKQCRYEADNRPWSSPITTAGVPSLPEGDLLHHKAGLVDGRWVITGSQNWSIAANENNDETLLIIDNAAVAAHFQREFDRLYQGAKLGIPPFLEQKLNKQRC